MPQSTDLDRVSMIVLRSMRGPIVLLISVYAIGMAGLVVIPGTDGEPMGFLHALYFLSYTATTTGFGELPVAFSDAQRMWAIVCLHMSVIAWLYSIGVIIRLIQNKHLKQAVSEFRFARRVKQLDSPFVVICGFGDAGSLLARSLNDHRQSVVIIDDDPDRIKALQLRNYVVPMPGVCGDSSDPQHLLNAGVRHPCCRAVAALTDDEQANARTAVMARCLNRDIRIITRIDCGESAEELESIDSTLTLDPFEIFAENLCTALHRPKLHVLNDWLAGAPGVRLHQQADCPEQRWIVCGYGRMGQRLEEILEHEHIQSVFIDPELSEEECSDRRIRGQANLETLQQADIENASCLIAATDSDTVNLRLMMLSRKINPDLFLVVRQNFHKNEPAFADAPIDLIMQPDRVLARRILLELISPAIPPLLEHLKECPPVQLDTLLDRLDSTLGDTPPLLWVCTIDSSEAPALFAEKDLEGSAMTLGTLLRDPRNRNKRLTCVTLVIDRGGEHLPTPRDSTPLLPGDRVTLCGNQSARNWLGNTLHDVHTLNYLLTGEQAPQSTFMRWLQSLGLRHTGA